MKNIKEIVNMLLRLEENSLLKWFQHNIFYFCIVTWLNPTLMRLKIMSRDSKSTDDDSNKKLRRPIKILFHVIISFLSIFRGSFRY